MINIHRVIIVGLKSSGGNEITRKLSKKLNANPNGRCSNISQCYEQVKMGSTVLIQVSIDLIIYKIINLCFNFSLYTQEHRSNIQSIDSCRSPPIKYLWNFSGTERNFRKYCHFKENKDGDVSPLTLRNLMGPFVILPIGYLISVLVFFIEKCFHHFRST